MQIAPLLLLSLAPALPQSIASDDGALVAAGEGWKARFDAGGATFTPALGPDAPHTRPVTFSLTRVGRDLGAPLAFDASAAPERHGERIRFERAPGLTERYDLERSGMEQSFLLASRPPGSGDLVIAGALTTDLALSTPADSSGRFHDGLSLHEGDLGGVRIGGVTAIDADGRSQAGWLEITGSELRLVVPAAFVDAAQYPLLVDPIWSSEITLPAGLGNENYDPTIAHVPSIDRYFIAYTTVFSAFDLEVHGQFLTDDGHLSGPVIVLADTEGDTWEHDPVVVDVPEAGRLLVAYKRRNPGGPRSIVGRSVAKDGSLGPEKTLVSTDHQPVDFDLVAGGEPASPGQALVSLAWGAFGGEVSRTLIVVTPSGPIGGSGQPTEVVLPAPPGPGSHYTRPIILGLGHIDQKWDVFSERYVPFSDDVEIWHNDQLLFTVSTDHQILLTGTTDGPFSYVLAYRTRELDPETGTFDPDDGHFDVRTFQVQTNFHAPSTVVFEPDFSIQGRDETSPAFVRASDQLGSSEEVVLVYAREFGDDARELVHRSYYDADGDVDDAGYPWPLAEPEQTATAEPSPSSIGQIAAAGDQSDGGAIAYTVHPNGVPQASDELRVAVFDFTGPGGPIVDLGGGCGDGGTLTVNGALALGSKDFELAVSEIGPTSLPIATLNLNFVDSILTCGPCVVMPWLITSTGLIEDGDASWAFPIAHAPSLFGVTTGAQVTTFHFPAPTLCPIAPLARFSNILDLTIGL